MLSNGEIQMRTAPLNATGEKLVLRNEPDNVDRVWLLSVRHSGTHYMYKYMEALGYEHCIVFWETYVQKHPTGEKQYIHAHLEVGHTYEKDLTCEKVVMPLRNPIEVYKSHVFRYKWIIGEYVPYILNAFKRFDEVVANRDTFVFRVDDEIQFTHVKNLAEFLNIPSGEYVYEDQPRNVGSVVKRQPTAQENILFRNGKMDPARNHAYDNPPTQILELASQYGY